MLNAMTRDADLPPFEECRTHFLTADYSSCLAHPQHNDCIYALLFGDGYLCTHPKHLLFDTRESSGG